MVLLEKIKALRRKIAAHDVTFWEGLPLLLAFIVPNVFEPAWAWRLIFYCAAMISLSIIVLHGVVAPELTFNAKIKYDWSPKGNLWFARISYALLVGGLVFVVYWSISPVSDLYRMIKKPNQALEQKVMEVIKTEGGGL